jgi:hypothetical protein
MSYPMALTTRRKFVQYPLRMRIGVAGKARRYRLMFVPVTKSTTKFMVFGRIVCQQGQSLLMTRPAIMGRGFLSIGDDQGHMDRMARQAGLKIHVLRVLFVAIHAAWNLPMGCVALVASHICVGAGVFFDLNTLLLVAGQAGCDKLTL